LNTNKKSHTRSTINPHILKNKKKKFTQFANEQKRKRNLEQMRTSERKKKNEMKGEKKEGEM